MRINGLLHKGKVTISEIIKQCGPLKIEEERVNSIDYDERVITADEIDQWNKGPTSILGSALKPAGQKTTPQDFALTVHYGGIFDD